MEFEFFISAIFEKKYQLHEWLFVHYLYGSKSKRNITSCKLHVYTTYGWICSLQTQIMRAQKKPGAIINIGSVAGLYPMHYEPIYSGTKGWSLFIVLRNVLKMAILFVMCKLWCRVVTLFLKFSEDKYVGRYCSDRRYTLLKNSNQGA